MMKQRKTMIAGLLAALMLTGCTQSGDPQETTLPTETPAAEQTQAIEQTQVTEPAPSKLELEDGVYTVDFVTDSKMFQANEAHDRKGTLTVQDGQGVLHISLGSKNIVNLYLGMAADAPGDKANWLQPTVDTVTYSDGLTEEVNGFDVPVCVVGEDFDLALIGKKGVWYDHKVSIQNPVAAQPGSETIADGAYICDVTLSGGSGRATVDSPAAVTVSGGKMTATVIWSSPNYEYMLVDGVQYDPIQTEGNSTFEIPVALDQDLAVSASTVAMSQPHLVDYVLHFDGSTLRRVED